MSSSNRESSRRAGARSENPRAGSDNASGMPSFDALRNGQTQRMVYGSEWENTAGTPDFQQRFNASRYFFPVSQQAVPRYTPSVASDTSSMAMTAYSRSSYGSTFSSSSGTPSLISSSGQSTGQSSVGTGRASSILLRNQTLLDEEGYVEDTVAPTQTRGGWSCPFKFLGCHKPLEDMHDFDMHSQFHLKGQLPKTMCCPFQGCEWSSNTMSGQETWVNRRSHIQQYHPNGGFVRDHAHPAMITHMWQRELISDAEEQELRSAGRLSGNIIPYVESGGRRADRRRERRLQERQPFRGSGNSG